MMSEQGSEPEGRASDGGEEILDFPESDHDEVHAMRDMDLDPQADGVVPDLPMESHAPTRVTVTQVSV